jgi:uncharacterized membrane protein YczE
MAASDKATIPLSVQPTRRLAQLAVGLAMYGLSAALLVRARLGNMPWDVFHQGLSNRLGLDFGTVSVIVGAAVLLLWIPLRQRPGIGTVSNIVVFGLSADLFLHLLATPSVMVLRWAYLATGCVICGLASGLYIGARLGPGPRDGLMTGLAARGLSIRLARTGIEVVVVAVGFVLGGTLGLGTVVYALTIGPLVQLFLPWFTIQAELAERPSTPPAPDAVPAS